MYCYLFLSFVDLGESKSRKGEFWCWRLGWVVKDGEARGGNMDRAVALSVSGRHVEKERDDDCGDHSLYLYVWSSSRSRVIVSSVVSAPRHSYVFCQYIDPSLGHDGGPCTCYDVKGGW